MKTLKFLYANRGVIMFYGLIAITTLYMCK